MTKEEFDHLTLEEVIEQLRDDGYDTIWSRDELLEMAKEEIDDDDRLFMAIHLLKALNNDYADYYLYDRSMGTLEEPSAIQSKVDLEDLIDFEN